MTRLLRSRHTTRASMEVTLTGCIGWVTWPHLVVKVTRGVQVESYARTCRLGQTPGGVGVGGGGALAWPNGGEPPRGSHDRVGGGRALGGVWRAKQRVERGRRPGRPGREQLHAVVCLPPLLVQPNVVAYGDSCPEEVDGEKGDGEANEASSFQATPAARLDMVGSAA